MNTDFWLERWARNEIGFHQPRFNEYLVAYWPTLGIDPRATAFVPLCGKTLDMRWLRQHEGHPVLGVEIARNACSEFFTEWGVEPQIAARGPFESFAAQGVNILCGDFFALPPADLTNVGGVFDRAALIALPAELRQAYARKLRELLEPGTIVLLVAPDYAQSQMKGPPFAVGEAEIRSLFVGCEIDMLAEVDVTDVPDNARFKQRGVMRFVERVFKIVIV